MLEPPFPPDERERLESLRSLRILDTPPEVRFDRITRIAAAALDVPIALVSLVDADRQWFKACIGLDVRQTDRNVSFCGHAILSDEPLVVPDATRDPRFASNPLVTGEPRIRFYAGRPLSSPEGRKLGTLCLIDRRPRSLSDEQLGLLDELGAWAEEELNSIGLTQAVLAERAMKARLESITEAVADGLVITDDRGSVQAVNRAAERIFGYERAELVGRDVGDLIPPSPAGEPGPWAAAGAGGSREAVGRRRDGSPIPLEVAISAMREGEQRLLIGSVRDVTERTRAAEALRMSEELYRSVIAAMSEGVMIVERGGAISACNAAAERILGLSADEMTDRGATDPRWRAVRPDGTPLPRSDHPAITTLRTGEPVDGLIMGIRRPDGERRWISVSSQPLSRPGEDGPHAAVSSFEDVTERLAVERMKDEFVSTVSHELRTPLTSIRGALGLVVAGAMGPLPDKATTMLEIAVSNSDRLIRLINDILDMERMASGAVTMTRAESDVAELITQVREVVEPMADRAGIGICFDGCEAALWVDADRIVQALTNLISNAVKFSPPGATVRLSVAVEGDRVVFHVIDRGRGIPQDKIATIFDRFQQVDASDSREKGGTGLGLAICRSIIDQHGGDIWVESAEGEGSTFSFALPTMEPEGPTPVAGNDGTRPIVLLCDDDPSTRVVVAAMLEEHGYRVEGAGTAEQAIALARRHRPDAILLDLVLPGMDGWTALAELKQDERTSDIPVVICSGVSPRPASADARSPEAGWVQKPLQEGLLLEELARALQGDRPRRVMLVEDDPDLARVLLATLEQHQVETVHARTVEEALALGRDAAPGLIILDMVLPDGDATTVVDELLRGGHLARAGLLVYTAADLSAEDRERLRVGADTAFLTKSRVSPETLVRRTLELLARIAPVHEEVVG